VFGSVVAECRVGGLQAEESGDGSLPLDSVLLKRIDCSSGEFTSCQK
jgi:hypothetical protein